MAATMGGHCKQYHMPFADVRQTIVRRSTNDRVAFNKQSCDVRQTIVRRSTNDRATFDKKCPASVSRWS